MAVEVSLYAIPAITKRRRLTFKLLEEIVARELDIKPELFREKTREQPVAVGRQIIWYLARKYFRHPERPDRKIPYGVIAFVYRKNHATIIHGERKAREMLEGKDFYSQFLINADDIVLKTTYTNGKENMFDGGYR